MKRRDFLKLPGLALTVPVFASALGRAASVGAQEALSGDLTLWHGWTGAEADTLNNDIIPAFKTAQPGVELTVLAVPFDQLKNKYQTEVASGGGPDLLIGPLDWVGEFVTAELIAPLDDLFDADTLANYLPTTVDALRYDGKLYGVPESFETLALFYNKTTVPEPPKTTADILSLAATIGAAGSDTYGLAMNSGFYQSAGFLFGFGASLFSDTDPVTSAINSPATVNFLTWIKDLSTKPGVWVKNDDAGMTSLFKEGKAAMCANGPWFTGDAQTGVGADNLGVAPLPTISEASDATPKPFLGVKHVMISANADDEKKALAFAFASWFTGPDSETFLAEKAGHLPAHTAVDVSANPIAQAFVTQAQNATPLPTIPAMGQVWAPADAMITKVLSGEATPEQAAADAASTIDKGIESSGA
jgi:maltose-binding protein MalE